MNVSVYVHENKRYIICECLVNNVFSHYFISLMKKNITTKKVNIHLLGVEHHKIQYNIQAENSINDINWYNYNRISNSKVELKKKKLIIK